MKKRRIIPTEHDEQVAVLQWWESYARTKKIDPRLLFAIPNASRLTDTGRIYKWKEGLRAGVPDLMLAWPKMSFIRIVNWRGLNQPIDKMLFAGLFLEMKRIGGKPSKAQLDMADLLRRAGYNVVIAYGFEEAQRAIRAYIES